MKHKKILFVCTGNTCRSPMAEALLKSALKERKIKWWRVSSCGIRAEVGGGISRNSLLALNEVGIDYSAFKPTQLTQGAIGGSTLVVTMTSDQKQLLEGCGNVCSAKDICGTDIPDPYGGSLDLYRITRDTLKRMCDELIDKYILKYEG